MPPFASLLPAAGVVHHRLLDFNRVVRPAGDHRHSVLFDAEALVRAGARVTDLCEDRPALSRRTTGADTARGR